MNCQICKARVATGALIDFYHDFCPMSGMNVCEECGVAYADQDRTGFDPEDGPRPNDVYFHGGIPIGYGRGHGFVADSHVMVNVDIRQCAGGWCRTFIPVDKKYCENCSKRGPYVQIS